MSTQAETLYRAKKIDSDEYIEFESYFSIPESLHNDESCRAIIGMIQEKVDGYEGIVFIPRTQKIDKSTLAIHFTNSGMEDSEGTPIFASLSSDGNGGTRIKSIHQDDSVAYFNSFTKRLEWMKLTNGYDREIGQLCSEEFKVTGIYEANKE